MYASAACATHGSLIHMLSDDRLGLTDWGGLSLTCGNWLYRIESGEGEKGPRVPEPLPCKLKYLRMLILYYFSARRGHIFTLKLQKFVRNPSPAN
ncbi:tigger transposable element-derived protein [Plakobranchus ocellatus]|uniref:Tigger transposable element-derived protein n=1 Tax=Plakobranchus ocellatus TaxID=259542 RepID=A0AAV3XTN2_9GAST|nr:tigger transposable element-derived protein [Plakobranchus ocellatus]